MMSRLLSPSHRGMGHFRQEHPGIFLTFYSDSIRYDYTTGLRSFSTREQEKKQTQSSLTVFEYICVYICMYT